jgi:hypothetical protein
MQGLCGILQILGPCSLFLGLSTGTAFSCASFQWKERKLCCLLIQSLYSQRSLYSFVCFCWSDYRRSAKRADAAMILFKEILLLLLWIFVVFKGLLFTSVS